MIMGMAHNVRGYRVFAAMALGALLIATTMEFGLAGFFFVSGIFGVVIPVAILVVAKMVFSLTWRSVRKAFPDEAKNHPNADFTFAQAVRTLWMA